MENTNKGETKYWEKNLSQCLSTPEIPHRLGWEWTWDLDVTRWWLTMWTMIQTHCNFQATSPWFVHLTNAQILAYSTGTQHASTLFPLLVYWVHIHTRIHLPNVTVLSQLMQLATWHTEWYWPSTCRLHACQAQTYHGNAAWSVRFTRKQTQVIRQTRVTFNNHQWETNQCTIATTWQIATNNK